MPPLLDPEAASTWHYPTNLPLRPYQFSIVQRCLHENCLVVLPTGLGKTFIAAVVMYNFRRWYPVGSKILFMAPTKPLVTQQMEAFCSTVEVDTSEVVELSGNLIPSVRESLWREKRIFFLTPQVLHNDLVSGCCPGKEVILVVVDEAHKASGRHAYCEALNLLYAACRPAQFRVLGLTATPASSISSIQTLIDALHISHVEYRTDESLDVQPFTQRKTTEKFVVELGPRIDRIQKLWTEGILEPYYRKLQQFQAIPGLDLADLTPYKLLLARDAYRRRMQGNSLLGAVEGYFAILISLLHSDEVLYAHGIVPFVNSITRMDHEGSSQVQMRLRRELESNGKYHELLGTVKEMQNEPDFISHPKIGQVENILKEYFQQTPDARAIVFSQYRESVMEIVARLNRQGGGVKAMSFVGQSSGKTSASFTQKQQMQV